jgi:N-acetylglutamate synthase-like GNAT family acetyltransferase
MIIIKSFNEIDNILTDILNKFIQLHFEETRLYSYEYIVYYINDNNDVIGFLGLQLFNDNIIINQLCVDINNRNKGIAKQLLEFVDKEFNNYNQFLYTHKPELYKFYCNRGFSQVYKDNIKIKMCKYYLKK